MIAYLLDMDGTLLDLPVDIEPARAEIAQLFEARGWTGPMRPILAGIESAAAQVAPDPDQRQQLVARARAVIDRAELAAAPGAVPIPGAPEVIARLSAAGHPLGLFTDNGRACVRPALEAAGIDPAAFAIIVTRDDVPRPKPDPAGAITAARAAGPHLPDTVIQTGDRITSLTG